MIDRRSLDFSLIVQGVADSPDDNPVKGTQYIVGEMPLGDFENAEPGQIARYDGEKWNFTAPKEAGLEVINAETGRIMEFNGIVWKTKVALVKAKLAENFTTVNYFSCKSYSATSSYIPNEIVINIFSDIESEIFANVFYADAEGKLIQINNEIPIGSKFLYNNVEDNIFQRGVYSYDKKDGTGSLHFQKTIDKPDVVFCKQTKHFYKLEGDTYVDAGIETPSYDVPTYEDIANAIDNIDFSKLEKFIVIDDFADEGNMVDGSIYIEPDLFLGQIYSYGYRNHEVEIYPCTFASKKDGMLYSLPKHGAKIIKKEIQDGAILFNKHYSTQYVYHVSDKSFERINQKIYIVDDIVDYMCRHIVEIEPQKIIFKEGSKRLTYTEMQEYHNNSWFPLDAEFVAVGKKYLALEDNEHDRIRIFERISDNDWRIDFSYLGWLYYNLEAGDYIINKADGMIYYFDGTNISAKNGGLEAKVSENITIPFVLNIVGTGITLPETCNVDDKFLKTDDAKIYTATAIDTWDAGTATVNGDKYASKTDFKIYEGNGTAVFATDIPNGKMLLNRADNCIYVYDAKAGAFIKTSTSSNQTQTSIPNSDLVTEMRVLTEDEAGQEFLNLKNNIMSGKENEVILSVNGVIQIFGIDYTASEHTINWYYWYGNIGRNIYRLHQRSLKAGDVFIIQYIKEQS